MAELLVKAQDNLHPDPTTDSRAMWKAGMPVVVMEDGHVWGSAEGLPAFWVIRIPTLTVAQALKYIDVWVDRTDPANPVQVRRREWQVDLSALPLAAQTKLATEGNLTIRLTGYNGAYDVTWQQARQAFRNVRTNTTE